MKRLPFKHFVLSAPFSAFSLAPSRSAVAYSDDFATNPLGHGVDGVNSRWISTEPGGSFPLVWTGDGVPTPAWSAALPANANAHSVDSSSDGNAHDEQTCHVGACARLNEEKPHLMDSVFGLKGRGSSVMSIYWKKWQQRRKIPRVLCSIIHSERNPPRSVFA